MSKNRRKVPKKQKQSASTPVNIVLPDSLSTEEMQQIITNALLAVEDAKERKIEEQKEQERKEWRELVKYKDYSDEKGIKKLFLTFLNRIKVIFNWLFAPKKKIKGSNMTIALLSIFLESFFDILKFVFLLATICFLGFIPLQIFIESLPKASVGQNIFFGTLGITSFILSRMFRIASVEIAKIEDRNLLFAIFASITSFISIIVAVLAIVFRG